MNFKEVLSSLATLWHLGHFPMSGTLASALTAFVWFLFPVTPLFHLSIIAALFVVGFYTSTLYLLTTDEIDPREVVIDEVLGMSIALFMAPHSMIFFLIAFLLFRFFDILKPFPINRCENLPGAWGILMDDAVAGLVTFLFCMLFAFVR